MATPQKYEPSAEYLSIKPDASGNAINGLGETEPRRASPMFWHPPDQQPFGAVAQFSRKSTRAHPKVAEKFQEANNHPPLIDVAAERPERSAQDWTQAAEAFALSHEADLFGLTSVKDHYIVDGYEIPEPTVVVLGVAHDYDLLKDMPETPVNPNGVFDVAQQYARGTRAAFALANWIRSQGFMAKAYPGPLASNLLLIPPAIDAGFGELGKHGSIINRTHGSGFRLAGVTTDMPLIETQQDEFGADAFCQS
ncbi:MAG: ortho-chlorophenol reductive dehalogenase, partial [Pseudomonadota bacterium]